MNNETFKILTDPNPVLRMPTKKVESFDLALQKTIDKMIQTMRTANGVGLAAPQVGILNDIVIVEYQPESGEEEEEKKKAFPLMVIVNPSSIELSKEKCPMVEGCLSFPEIKASVIRPQNIKLKAQDRWGKEFEISADSLLGRAIQHELDHLKGILLIDRLEKINTVLITNMELGLPALITLVNNPGFNFQTLVCTDKTDIKHSQIDIKNEAKKLNIPVTIWKDEQNIYNKLKSLKPDLIIVAGFGKKISDRILNLPKFGCLNIHPSLLPLYRGPSPIQSTILNGDKITGVSIIKMTNSIDAGPILAQATVKLSGMEYYKELLTSLATLGAELLIDIVPHFIAGEITPETQDEAKASYTKIFKKEDGLITKSDTAEMINRKVRAFHHWPKAYTFCGERQVQILESELDKEGKLILKKVQPAGKNVMDYKEFVCGYKKPLANLSGKISKENNQS